MWKRKTLRSGEFSRTKLVTTQVQITKPSVSNTKLNVERTVEKGIVVIMVTPFDQFKNNLGPGYSRLVEITASNGQFTGPVIDNLDGTYSRVLRAYRSFGRSEHPIKVLGSDIARTIVWNYFSSRFRMVLFATRSVRSCFDCGPCVSGDCIVTRC